MQDAFRRHWLETTCIDNEIRLIPQSTVAIVAISRQSRNIRHDRVATTGQAVEER